MSHLDMRGRSYFGQFETRTETFPMRQSDEVQMFHFKEPILCVGGLLKVRLTHVN
jgi:hypothetical protein